MTGIRSESDKADTKSLGTADFTAEKLSVSATVTLRLGEKAMMTLTDGKKTVSVKGDIPSPAENSPLTEEGVKARLAKMGNTNLLLNPENIDLTLDGGINLPPSALNALRRSAAEAFESSRRELGEVVYQPPRASGEKKPIRSATFFCESAFLSALRLDARAISSLDMTFVPIDSSDEALAGSNGVALPPILLDSELCEIILRLKNAKNIGVMYALVCNIGQIELVKSLGFIPVGDFRLNVTNGESAELLYKKGLSHIILSPELTLPKARDISGSVITYGRIPLMVTERCFIKENFGCKNCATATLIDRKGEKFPIRQLNNHRNIIFNSLPTYMGDKADELIRYRLLKTHMLFTVESGSQILEIIRADKAEKPLTTSVRRIGRR
jgi:putative protease